MTIWSSIWLILIAFPLICHYTLVISHSFLCVYTCSLSVRRLCAQTAELMEESEKQIKISPGLAPSSPLCLTPYHLFANFSIIIFLFMLVCLFTCFFLPAPSLWRCRFPAKSSLSSITSPCTNARNLQWWIQSVLFTSSQGVRAKKKWSKFFEVIFWHFQKYPFSLSIRALEHRAEAGRPLA